MRASSLPFALPVLLLAGPLPAVPPEPQYKLVLQAPPATGVDSVAVSPDGSVVASAAGEGGVRLHDARSGALLRVLGDVGDRGVVFSPDGRLLTAAGFHMDKLASLWDARTGKRLKTFPGHTEWETDAVAISPDGKLLASTGVDRQILVWEIATGKLRLQLKDQPARAAALAFSPDSATLASGGGDRIVRLWDSTTGALRKSLPGQSDWICTIAFSPDGSLIASGSCDWGFHRGHDWPRPAARGQEQCEWRLLEIASGDEKQSWRGPGQLLSLAFSPGGKALACGAGKGVWMHDLASGRAPMLLTSHDAGVTSVTFTPDGAAIVSSSHDQTVRRTAMATGAVEWRTPGWFEQVNSVALSEDGTLLVTGSSDHRFARARLQAGTVQIGPGSVRLWDARTGRFLRRLGDPEEQVMAVALTFDGRRVVAGCGIRDGKGAVRVWDAASGEPLWTVLDHAAETLAVAFAPGGSTLASAAADGLVNIRSAATGLATRSLTDHRGGATSIVFSPEGRSLFCAEAYGGARVWEVDTGRLIQTYKPASSQAETFTLDRLMNCLALSRDGTTLATCASSVNDEYVEPVRLWDARTGALQRGFAAEKIQGRPMALSPDGSLIATGGKWIKLWDARSGVLVRELYGHLKRTQSIIFSADGRTIISGGSYGTTNIWEVATGRHLVTLIAFCDKRNGALTDDWLAYNPDGYYDGSANVDSYLAWRVGGELQTPETLGPELHRPERVTAALKVASGDSREPERQLGASGGSKRE
jgi:WD40 repeat protein